jgi:hypothetical protein
MTAITLPLKKIPGQSMRLPTFFGGRKFTTPLILMLTALINTYFYIRVYKGNPPYFSLISFLPYLWGLVSIIYYIKKSNRVMGKIVETDLDNAERIFKESKVEFREILVSTCVSSMIMIAVFFYILQAYGMLPLFVIGISSITSVGITIAAIISQYEFRSILSYIVSALAVKATFMFLVLNGRWELGVIFPLSSLVFIYSRLHQVKVYDLRTFFERVIE